MVDNIIILTRIDFSGKTTRDEGLSGNIYLEETSDSDDENTEQQQMSSVVVDSWIVFSARQEVAGMITGLRQKWNSVWTRRLASASKHNKVLNSHSSYFEYL